MRRIFSRFVLQAEVHTNRERAATLLRAERRVEEREKWLEGEQQELDQTRDRVSQADRFIAIARYDGDHISRVVCFRATFFVFDFGVSGLSVESYV